MAKAVSVTQTTKKPTKATKNIRKQQSLVLPRGSGDKKTNKNNKKHQFQSSIGPWRGTAATKYPQNIAVVEHKGLSDVGSVLFGVSI
jgi:hypothetical protein